MKTFLISLRLLALLTLLTGFVYPAFVWAVGRVCFPTESGGSLVLRDGQVVGSALLAQKNDDPRYIQPRPSAGDYATVASAASNQAWTSAALRERIATAAAAGVSDERATASGSGLDPHLTPEAVLAQLDRVATARGWDAARRARAEAWIAEHTEGGQIGPAYVNVFLLNLALDRLDAGQP